MDISILCRISKSYSLLEIDKLQSLWINEQSVNIANNPSRNDCSDSILHAPITLLRLPKVARSQQDRFQKPIHSGERE